MYNVQGLVVVSGAVTVAGGWEAVGLWWELPPCNVFIKWELLLIMWEQLGRLPKPKGSLVDLIWELPPCNVLNHVGAEESSLIKWEQFNPFPFHINDIMGATFNVFTS